jgi:putative transposase
MACSRQYQPLESGATAPRSLRRRVSPFFQYRPGSYDLEWLVLQLLAASWTTRTLSSLSDLVVTLTFFPYPADVRKIIYTTNAIESLHMQLRKIIKNRGHFLNDDAAIKLLYLALRNITKDWKMSAREWKSAMNQFAILFADRFMPQSH